MKRTYLLAITLSVFVGILIFFSYMWFYKPIKKNKVISNIEAWYKVHSDGYTIKCDESSAKAKITRYHTDRPEEKNYLIRIAYNTSDMLITLAFQKPLNELVMHKDTLKKYLHYVVIDYIHNDIQANGWNIYPRTPSSSTEEGVTFIKANTGHIVLSIDWEIYNVSGYSDSDECQEELSMADNTISKKFIVSVTRDLPTPLHIDVDLKIE